MGEGALPKGCLHHLALMEDVEAHEGGVFVREPRVVDARRKEQAIPKPKVSRRLVAEGKSGGGGRRKYPIAKKRGGILSAVAVGVLADDVGVVGRHGERIAVGGPVYQLRAAGPKLHAVVRDLSRSGGAQGKA